MRLEISPLRRRTIPQTMSPMNHRTRCAPCAVSFSARKRMALATIAEHARPITRNPRSIYRSVPSLRICWEGSGDDFYVENTLEDSLKAYDRNATRKLRSGKKARATHRSCGVTTPRNICQRFGSHATCARLSNLFGTNCKQSKSTAKQTGPSKTFPSMNSADASSKSCSV